MTERAKAAPTKDFFLYMLTKDIALSDCILDLLDNAVDGARRHSAQANDGGQAQSNRSQERVVSAADSSTQDTNSGQYAPYTVDITLDADRFKIRDNCGGMSVAQARDYAFRFGRHRDANAGPAGSIGLYGIGMKRAIFKMGMSIRVASSTADEAFEVPIDVAAWASTPEEDPDEWTFPLEVEAPATAAGTTVEVRDLYAQVAEEFADAKFREDLERTIARDYSFYLQQGLTVRVGDDAVAPYAYAFGEGVEFEAVNFSYEDGGVRVVITAGMAAAPPEDDSAEAMEDAKDANVAYYGWFVACNDRIVLAGDKSARTVWGDEGFTYWHPQYNGFMGLVSFHADDPNSLPWTTTKRDVDVASPLYRRAVVKMKEVTRAYVAYTNRRKGDLETARQMEKDTTPTLIGKVAARETLRVPTLTRRSDVATTTISYTVIKREKQDVAEALGNRFLSNKDVGLRTFEYFREREVGE